MEHVMNLASHSHPRVIIHIVVRPHEIVEHALESTEGTPADRALMVVAFTLMHLYGHPDDRTQERIATIAPLFDVLLDQPEPRASEDVRTVWAYVADVFEPGSAVRELLVEAVSPRAREVYASVLEELETEADEDDDGLDEDEDEDEDADDDADADEDEDEDDLDEDDDADEDDLDRDDDDDDDFEGHDA
jgi:hypothetical protein